MFESLLAWDRSLQETLAKSVLALDYRIRGRYPLLARLAKQLGSAALLEMDPEFLVRCQKQAEMS